MNRRTLIAWLLPIIFLITLATFVWLIALTPTTGGPAR
jgi:hypothetical protein